MTLLLILSTKENVNSNHVNELSKTRTSKPKKQLCLSFKDSFGRPSGNKSWRWEAKLKSLCGGRSCTLPVLTGNGDKCAS